MSRRRPPATNVPFDMDAGPPQWVFCANGHHHLIMARSRRTVLVDYNGERVRLKRRNLERDGFDAVGPLVLFVTKYQLPPAA